MAEIFISHSEADLTATRIGFANIFMLQAPHDRNKRNTGLYVLCGWRSISTRWRQQFAREFDRSGAILSSATPVLVWTDA
jgi:hypothetical protein